MADMILTGVTEGNLKNISLELPKEKLIVLTGVSGSGKSTLAMDVIHQECQRQYLEAISYQGLHKPKLVSMKGASPAVCITQERHARNPRSSVGTVTNIYSDLRMVYEKLSRRICPSCGEPIQAALCREETEKKGDEFRVFMYCSECGHRMDKLTRTWFSHNTKEGACPECQGLGRVLHIDESRVFHEERPMEDGAVDFWEYKYGEYQTETLYRAFAYYGLPVPKGQPLAAYEEAQRTILCYGTNGEEVKHLFPEQVPPKTVAQGKFEGVFPMLWRRIAEKGGEKGRLDVYFTKEDCPECKGERLNPLSRSVTVMDTRLPELTRRSLKELYDWIEQLEQFVREPGRSLVEPYLLDIRTKIRRLVRVGLGYLTLDRETMTLSGGEGQRLKLAATLDSELTGVLYILDEPTSGLHPKDTEGMIEILKGLRDLGNTVLVIEHDTDVMREADVIIDIGPGAGKYGGEIVGKGTLTELMHQECSVTGRYLRDGVCRKMKQRPNPGDGGRLIVEHAEQFNLKGETICFPTGCLTSVTGVSGSGKSTLVFEVLAGNFRKTPNGKNDVRGQEAFTNLITVEQQPLVRMSRSNIATYSGVYAPIRNLFGKSEEAKKRGLDAKHFSFNSKGGRCEHCQGLGVVKSNLLFFEDVEIPCPVCGGKQFLDEVLEVTYRGYGIRDVLKLSVEEACEVFADSRKILRVLELLKDVGLGYLELGQTLTTLSGGEAQRLKLAKELTEAEGTKNLYLIDEPTTGLHPLDVEHFLRLLHRMVDAGNTVIVVEHNQQVIEASDWVIDLGPGGGNEGGRVVAQGTPEEIKKNPDSVTGRYLR